MNTENEIINLLKFPSFKGFLTIKQFNHDILKAHSTIRRTLSQRFRPERIITHPTIKDRRLGIPGVRYSLPLLVWHFLSLNSYCSGMKKNKAVEIITLTTEEYSLREELLDVLMELFQQNKLALCGKFGRGFSVRTGKGQQKPFSTPEFRNFVDTGEHSINYSYDIAEPVDYPKYVGYKFWPKYTVKFDMD